jgi:hypothetical protein
MAQDTDATKRFMMEIEIRFGKGRSDRIAVHYDDEPIELAKVECWTALYSVFLLTFNHITSQAFIAKHKLKETSIPVITQYLKDSMDTHLRKRIPRKPKEEPGTYRVFVYITITLMKHVMYRTGHREWRGSGSRIRTERGNSASATTPTACTSGAIHSYKHSAINGQYQPATSVSC